VSKKGKNAESTEATSHPIYTMIADRVRALCAGLQPVLDALTTAERAIVDEFDVFVRNGNRTAYNLDGLAFSSAKIEHLKTGGEALTYSTMEGRRVDDILYAVLDHLSRFVYPASERQDVNQAGPNTGKPKLNHRRAERDKWITSLGYVKTDVGKGKRNLFGDAFQDLKDQLETLIPERFDGTERPSTALQQMPLITPTRLSGSQVIYLNVYRPTADAEKIASCVALVKLFLKDGFTFQRNKDSGVVKGEIASFYDKLLGESLDVVEETREAQAA
jgi:hypothetical protein